jgi:phospholipid transport system transporter-binding protein
MQAFALPAAATLDQAPEVLAQFEAALSAAEGGVRVDASALAECDTSTISLLLQAQRLAQARGLALQVAGAPAKLRQLARLYGVLELLPLLPDAEPPPRAGA